MRGARLDDCSDCSTEAGRSIYPKWVIPFYSKWTISSQRVCALIVARRGKGERRFGAPPFSAKGRASCPCPIGQEQSEGPEPP